MILSNVASHRQFDNFSDEKAAPIENSCRSLDKSLDSNRVVYVPVNLPSADNENQPAGECSAPELSPETGTGGSEEEVQGGPADEQVQGASTDLNSHESGFLFQNGGFNELPEGAQGKVREQSLSGSCHPKKEEHPEVKRSISMSAGTKKTYKLGNDNVFIIQMHKYVYMQVLLRYRGTK